MRSAWRWLQTRLRWAPRRLGAVRWASEGERSRIAGTPEVHRERRVRIYRPARSANQQGRGSRTQLWRAEFETLDGYGNWVNPLMGWTSTGDPLSQTFLTFSTKEAAVDYAQRNGLAYVVYEPHQESVHRRNIVPFGRAMVHHWRHEGVPQYDSWNAEAEAEAEVEQAPAVQPTAKAAAGSNGRNATATPAAAASSGAK
ncbi:hypothetical protein CDCA_CDCA15G4071 [Cyanidium caldarium]|uniref:NADH dehydrogenase [ubiquinone] iron-sulfur protein 4, mitochondrial n=1 Tax=Cyanidium caldarium TaxID=2771 RepID=A0AAV9J189_CYACA|nr:hypothetical protein CDCA_CDCA15G4071 [Cyanidium caldarium]